MSCTQKEIWFNLIVPEKFNISSLNFVNLRLNYKCGKFLIKILQAYFYGDLKVYVVPQVEERHLISRFGLSLVFLLEAFFFKF